jgi:hypothetical protein
VSTNPSTAFPCDGELLEQLRQQLACTEQRLQYAELKIQQLEERLRQQRIAKYLNPAYSQVSECNNNAI